MALADVWWRSARRWRRAAGASPRSTSRSRGRRAPDGPLDLEALAAASPRASTARSTCWSATAWARSSRSGCWRASRASRERSCSRSRRGPGASTCPRWRRSSSRTRRPCAASGRRWLRASARRTRAGIRATSSAPCAASRRPTSGDRRSPGRGRCAGTWRPSSPARASGARARRPRRAGDLPARSRLGLRGADRDAVRAALAPERFVVIEGGHCLHRDDAAGWVERSSASRRAALG